MKSYEENIFILDLKGKDVIDFLQRVSTNDILKLGNRDNLRTVFLNYKGKIIDFISIIKYESSILLVASKGNEGNVTDFVNKYIITDDVSFDICKSVKITFIPQNNEELNGFNGVNLIEDNYYYYDDFRFKKLIVIEYNDNSLYLKNLKEKSTLLTESEYRDITIDKAYVFDSYELNEEIIPLECHLEEFISYNKGCYIGQEVISRLDSQAKIPKVMVKIKSDVDLKPDDKIFFEEKGVENECGFITSAVNSHNGSKALGFIRNIYLKDNYNFYVNKAKKEFVTINKFK